MNRRTLTSMTAAAVAVLALLAGGAPAGADHAERVILLPGATSAEGIASGPGSTFYAGDLFGGDIYRGDVRKGTAEKFIDNAPGRNAAGLRVDLDDGLLFVAGGFTGQGYVYDTDSGATVEVYQFSTAASVINDVAVTSDGAWFTNSLAGELYFVPVVDGEPGPFTVLDPQRAGGRHERGVQQQRHPGHSRRLDPDRGAQRPGRPQPRRPGHRRQLDRRRGEPGERRRHRAGGAYRLRRAERPGADRPGPAERGPGSGTVTKVITSELFAVPATVARFGDLLAAVNAHFDTGFPPTSPTYEVVVVDR